ncbi:MAG: redoxin domain-containing protein [Elusimicrobia bacterium]|nr:redoxin domain-containing protein [Elusimicrobiota bacterium]
MTDPRQPRPAEEILCPFCGTPVWSDDEECLQCNAPLVPGVCRHCRHANPPLALRCERCGSPNLIRQHLSGHVQPAQPEPPSRSFLFSLVAALSIAVLGFVLHGRWKAATEPPPQGLQAPGVPAADFSLLDQDGQRQTLSGLAAGRPAVLYGFSGDCAQCRTDLGRLVQAVGSNPPEGAAFVGLMHQGTPPGARSLKDSLRLPGSILADADGSACGNLGIGEFTVIVLDRKRRPVFRGGVTGMTQVLPAALALP